MLTYNTDSITIGDGIASVCLPACLAWLGLAWTLACQVQRWHSQFAVSPRWRSWNALATTWSTPCACLCVCLYVCVWLGLVLRSGTETTFLLAARANCFGTAFLYSPPQQQNRQMRESPGTTTSSRTDSSCTYVRRPLRCSIQRSCSKYPWRSRSNSWNSFCWNSCK